MLVRGKGVVCPGKQLQTGAMWAEGGGVLDVQLLELVEAHVAYLLDGQVWTLQDCIGEVDVGDVPAKIRSEHA